MLNSMKIKEEDLLPEKIIQGILADESAWRAFASFCRTILKEKEAEERRREKQGLDNPESRGTVADLESNDTDRMGDLEQ